MYIYDINDLAEELTQTFRDPQGTKNIILPKLFVLIISNKPPTP